MEIIVIDKNTKKYEHETSLAIGFFDGVHLGHRKILDAALSARAEGEHAAVFTFLDSSEFKRGVLRITDEREKLSLFESMGFDVVFLCSFESVKEMNAEEFTDILLLGVCSCRQVACGSEFRFGKGAVGGVDILRTKIPHAHVCEELLHEGEAISSTRIRHELEAGRVERANAMLGYSYFLVGEVLHGKALGGKLGFPTINQRFAHNSVLPRYGVYISRVSFDTESYLSVSNVGRRPTVDGDFVNIETNIIGFDGDLYGRCVRVELLRFIREERRFESVEALREQVMRDRETAVRYGAGME